jgi:hypothetical protein
MGWRAQYLELGKRMGGQSDPPAVNPDDPATMIALYKAILATLPTTAPDPPQADLPRFRQRVPESSLGAPFDPIATDTTGAWTTISLLKGILQGFQNNN